MNRVKYTTTTTGTGVLTISVASGFQSGANSRFTRVVNSKAYYILLDANATAWEHGFGTISGSSFYRDTIFESTNSDAAISLSAGTHSLLITMAGIEGVVVPYGLSRNGTVQTITAGATSDITWTHDGGQGFSGANNLILWPGANELGAGGQAALPQTGSFDASSILSYARAWRAHLDVQCTAGATGDMFGARLQAEDGSVSYESVFAEGWAPLVSGSAIHASASLPWCNMPSGINGVSNEWKGPTSGMNTLYTKVTNTSSSSIDVHPKLVIEYLL